jgi:hypothetical protein
MEPNTTPTPNVIPEPAQQQTSSQPGIQAVSDQQTASLAEPESNFPFPVKKLFFITIGLFIASTLGSIVHQSPFRNTPVLEFFEIAVYIWFIAVLFAAGVVMSMFINGLFNKNHRGLLVQAVLALLLFAVVGFGTCMFNMNHDVF